MPELLVRPYLLADRSALLRIAGDTGFFGEPIEAIIEDRTVFLDAFYAYYIDLEPDHAWVACVNGEVIGFLVGCVDTRHQPCRWLRSILPGLLSKLLRGRYRLGRRTFGYLFSSLENLLLSGSLRTNLKSFPAHLHINLDTAWRHHGLGGHLMEAYLGQLRCLGVRGVHLHTTSLNEAACRLYEKIGFRMLDARPDRTWTHWFQRPVERRCYGLALT
jgi:ribosomal protein S18 acetylase RimI-like enzyme